MALKVKVLTVYKPNGEAHTLHGDDFLILKHEAGELIFTMQGEGGKGRIRVITSFPYWLERDIVPEK